MIKRKENKKTQMSRYLILILLLFGISQTKGQTVYQDVSNKAIYEFIDELANEQFIIINSAIKPYSRRFIAEKLQEASEKQDQLNKRQQKDLDFYLCDYNKELIIGIYDNKRFDIFYHSDSVFSMTINGILGAQGWNNENGINYHRWFGAETFGYVGKHVGIYASLRDNTEKIRLADTNVLTIRHGGKYRAGDYSESRGGITLSWKWGTIGLVKDYIEWGTNYRYPNIVSSKAPSVAQIKLHLYPTDWFEFCYFHGWLVSEVVDSSRSYNYNGVQRNVYHGKYMAANMFIFKPWQKLNLGFGNSIIYSDIGVHPAYLNPLMFYKSVDHTYNGATNTAGQNSQMFFNLSGRFLPKTHLYYSMFIDVMSFGTLFDKEEHANHWSMQGGVKISNILPNTSLTLEYTRTNPLAYKNDNLTTLYNSNWYNLGHYLGDNARGVYLALDIKPLSQLYISLWYALNQKGPDYPYVRENEKVLGIPYMESIEWEQQLIGLKGSYQFLNDFFIFAEIEKQDITGNYERYNSEYYWGNTLTLSFGLNYGF
jgi:hypothetical protein